MRTAPRVEWTSQASSDLLEIVDYLSDHSPAAAQLLKDEIAQKVAALPAHPEKYAESSRAPGYRQITVRRNYLVFYRLLGHPPVTIEVSAVVHARRRWPS